MPAAARRPGVRSWLRGVPASRSLQPITGSTTPRALGERRYNSVMARGDVVIANSQYTADHVAQVYGLPNNRLRIVYPGLDSKRFCPGAVGAARRTAILEAWGLKEDGRQIVLLPGRLTAWKGQETFVDAMACLFKAGKLAGVTGVIAGDDQGRTNYREGLEQRIAEAGLNRSASRSLVIARTCRRRLPFQTVAISASTEPEAFGRIAAEAEAMETPVIATDHGGARETVLVGAEDVRTGWRVPPGDRRRARKGDRNRPFTERSKPCGHWPKRPPAHAVAAFDNEAMCARTIAIYKELVEARS